MVTINRELSGAGLDINWLNGFRNYLLGAIFFPATDYDWRTKFPKSVDIADPGGAFLKFSG